MGWATNFLNRIFDQQEKLSPAEAEEAARKIRTQKRAEKKRLDEERAKVIRDQTEKFRLPGTKGSSSYKYSNAKIKGTIKENEWELVQQQKEELRDWISQISLTHENPDQLKTALKSGDPKDLTYEDRRKWEYQESKSYPSAGGPSTKIGKRGGRYTDGTTKDGRPYRRYF